MIYSEKECTAIVKINKEALSMGVLPQHIGGYYKAKRLGLPGSLPFYQILIPPYEISLSASGPTPHCTLIEESNDG